MCASVNKVILLGNLGTDPELRYTPGGVAVCNFSLATNERGRKGDGDEKTEWHRIVVWDKLAERCNEYLKKGRTIYLEGRLQTRKWQDRDGHDRYTTEIVAQIIQFVGGDRQGGQGGSGGPQGGGGGGYQDREPRKAKPQVNDSPAPSFPEDDDDFPF